MIVSPTLPFGRYFLNSALVSLGTTALVLVAGSWGAYALARLEFKGRRTFGISLLLIQLFPAVLLVIPLFVVFAQVGLVNNLLGLVVAYTTFNLPFVTWLLRGYFLSIPRELEDAARIDGCSYLGVLFRIVLPMAAPGLAAVATLAFVQLLERVLLRLRAHQRRCEAGAGDWPLGVHRPVPHRLHRPLRDGDPHDAAGRDRVRGVPTLPRRRTDRRRSQVLSVAAETLVPREGAVSDSSRSDGSISRPHRRPASPARRRLLQAGSALGLGTGRRAAARQLAGPGARPRRSDERRACARQPAPSSSGAARPSDNGARQPLINAHLAAFDRANGTTSTAQFMVFQESIQKTQAAIAAGTPPDLGQQGPDVTMQFVAAGHMLPIDDVAAQIMPTLAPLSKDAFVSYGGSSYTVPWYIETRVLFYHKDLLEQAGVKPPTTWAEWVEVAKALTTPDQFGFVVPMEGTNPGQLFIPLGDLERRHGAGRLRAGRGRTAPR